MNNVHELIGRLARVEDEELAGRASAAGARTLLASIVIEESREATVARLRPFTARRLVVGMTAAAVLAAAVVAGPSILGERLGSATSYANAAVAIQREGDHYVARIKDPFADHQEYTEAFHAVGLKVDLRLVPVSPGAVGKAVEYGVGLGEETRTEDARAGDTSHGDVVSAGTEPEGCEVGQPGCSMVLKIPERFAGNAWVKLGRQALPQETYQNHGSATDSGEILAGVRVDGRAVGEVLAELRARKAAAEFSLVRIHADNPDVRNLDDREDPDGAPMTTLTFDPVPGDKVGAGWTVWEAEPVKEGVVRLLVTPEHLDHNPLD
ncbi:hypothetical protein [Planotetraspora sp. GP83]|uniref:hypothetical protein n=1 Tax=Planotetraspora sp. GP83 TaxID=3156264 RepID=UPI003519B647